MSKVHLQQAEIKVEYIPAHKFIGIWDITSSSYGEFWQGGRSCDEIAARWKVCPILHFQNNWARPQDGSTRMDKRDTLRDAGIKRVRRTDSGGNGMQGQTCGGTRT